MRFSPSRALAARWLVSSGISLLPAVLSGQLGPVAGTVTSRASGAPVADVQVTVAGTTLRALTDASGRFRFGDVPGTMVVLQARRIGFRAAEDTIRVGNENVRIALEEKVLELSQVVVTGTPTATAPRGARHPGSPGCPAARDPTALPGSPRPLGPGRPDRPQLDSPH